jgi:hypothetical protein
VPLQVALFVVVLWRARLARARARRRAEKEPSEQAAAQVFELPLSSALVLALLTTGWIYPQAPLALRWLSVGIWAYVTLDGLDVVSIHIPRWRADALGRAHGR